MTIIQILTRSVIKKNVIRSTSRRVNSAVKSTSISHFVVRSATTAANSVATETPASPSHLQVTDVKATKNNGILGVTWENGTETKFSNVFLRDCCRCSECYNASAQQRTLDTVPSVPLDIRPRNTDIDDDAVHVTWDDGHVSSYTHESLWRQHVMTATPGSEKSDIRYIKPTPWTADDISGKIPTFDFNAVLENDVTKYDWFHDMMEVGVTLLTGAGREDTALDRFKQLFGGYFKSTHYGETFVVETKPDPSSLAYTPQAVLPHVDLPHYEVCFDARISL